ncbi:MAG: hypothetical protein IT161_04605 [Bryobacterales bacterium]|nr:hypothetical protein [Bryobacterales bacterium]
MASSVSINPNIKACSKTNELGQYALLVAPGTYSIEVRDYTGALIHDGHVAIAAPGFFRDHLSLQEVPAKVSQPLTMIVGQFRWAPLSGERMDA